MTVVDRSVAAAAAFDALAADYDRTFTDTVIGGRMRAAVHRRTHLLFPPGSKVLELNCGTGVDALWLARHGVDVVATDVSADMVAVTAARAAACRDSLPGSVVAEQVAIESIGSRFNAHGFDGALSNFGGLNCVHPLDDVATSLSRVVRPGGRLLLCIMGPHVPWEWLWFAARADLASARRRMARSGTEWRGVRITYPTVGDVQRAFTGSFDVDRVWALGALLPPPYTERALLRLPGARTVLGALDAVERRLEVLPGLARLADHFVVELTRR